jgi:glycine/D-amino acid oxidase-like deaminating enzyme
MQSLEIKNTSFWWEKAAPNFLQSDRGMPQKCDTMIIGGGYSGLSVALNLARAGRDVIVIDQDTPGQHASTINFGAAGRTIRPKLSELVNSYGLKAAVQIMKEAKDWLEYTVDFIKAENIECEFNRAGRIYCAHTPAAYENLARSLEFEKKYLNVESHMVSKSEQHSEVGSDSYFGLMVLRDVGHLHPALYYKGLLEKTLSAGVSIYGNTKALSFKHDNDGHSVKTNAGEVRCKELVICTNAVTGSHDPLLQYFRRRIIPVNNWTVVTEPVSQDLIKSVLPKGRLLLETVLLYTGLRPIESENRLAIAGRHLFNYNNHFDAAMDVRKQIAFSFPQLKDVNISHCWNGTFAMTFDWLPHFGRHEQTGAYYLLGLVGTGVPSTAYFGNKLANMILDKRDDKSIFQNRNFSTMPFYYGDNKIILSALRSFYRTRDNTARAIALLREKEYSQ